MKIETKIVLIGAGNVATQLGIALTGAGYHISQVYSPTKRSASLLAKKVKAAAITDLAKVDEDASVYIIAVKDDAITDVAKQLRLKDRVVAHTSGSVSMDVLKNVSKNYGVFYPLLTFTKDKKVDFKTVPICIEGSNKATSTTLQYFAKSISSNVQMINSDQRKVIHLAAVFACNFSNHMYAVAESILKKNKLSLDILKPLIEETALKIRNESPAKVQTGPAVRGDKKTMEGHLKMLKKNKDLSAIYKLVSKHIPASK
ncbi:MAG: oxidoreductase [Bacteroidetes bacterium]|nr:oxidoreductase [Bacteroidota bacterium]